MASRKNDTSVVGAAAVIAIASIIAFAFPPARHSNDQDREIRSTKPTAGSLTDGRGRDANSPIELPAKGWKDVFWRTYEQIGEDRFWPLPQVSYFTVCLALFPAITALVSSYALIADPITISDHLAALSGILPAGSFAIVRDQVERVLAKGDFNIGATFAISLLLAVWSANGGMKAIINALNVVYNEREKRGFFALNATSLAFTVGGLAAILIAIGLVVAAPIILASIGLKGSTETIVKYGRWPALALVLLIGLAVLYRFAPSRVQPRWRWVAVGSIAGTIVWIIDSAALSFYLSNYADYDDTYGSLGAAIGLMMWMWMSTIVVLFGAELNLEIEHQTAQDSTGDGGKPMGTRGAHAADTVGQSKDA